MKTIEAAQFREQCLTLLNGLDSEGLVVTEGGKPIARVLPIEEDAPPAKKGKNAHLIGILRGKGEIRGDIMSTGIRWDADDQS